jgi:hypothetical protein
MLFSTNNCLIIRGKARVRKDELTRNFTEAIRVQQSRYLEDDMSALANAERKLREYMGYIKTYSDKRIRLQSNIESSNTYRRCG